MAKTRPPYTPEFREEALRLLRTGAGSPREVAAALGCSEQTLRSWQRQDARANGDGPALPGAPDPPPAPTVRDVLARRSWVIALVTVLAAAAAWGYAQRQAPRYQGTATVLAHPTAAVTKVTDLSTDLSLLSYGSLEQTFVALARSDRLLDQAPAGMGFDRAERDRYRAVANVLPGSTVLEISVTGPDRRAVVTLANRLAAVASSTTRALFPIFSLSPLDPAAAPAAQVAPRTRESVLFGGLAGLIAGFVVAVLTLRVSVPSRLRRGIRLAVPRRRPPAPEAEAALEPSGTIEEP
jgi:capsular polysaccharide biosynthesis protein